MSHAARVRVSRPNAWKLHVEKVDQKVPFEAALRFIFKSNLANLGKLGDGCIVSRTHPQYYRSGQ
jgi:hypothetical protein